MIKAEVIGEIKRFRMILAIAPLHHYPACASILACWAYQEWYKDRPLDFSVVLHAYRERARHASLPQSFVALADSQPVGMATLKLDDLRSCADINPWFSSLYVVPVFRNRGIGAALIQGLLARARELGYKDLHLFLGQRDPERLERYYCSRGWNIIGAPMDNDGLPTKVLRYTLKDQIR